MKKSIHFILFIASAILLISSCRKEDKPVLNNAPTTQLFLSNIDRSGPNRLNTIVDLHWSGEDKDGYVVGYELSFDNVTWTFTTSQDSTFRFSISSNSDTADIDFYVRAIDNDGNKDQTPAFLRIPIKNAIPTVEFDTHSVKGDTVFSVFSLLWTAKDLDGFETIDSIFVKLNSGDWFGLSRNYSFITLVPVDPSTVGTSNAKVYQGYEASLSPRRISGLKIGDMNQVYIKVRDVSGAESTIDTLKPFFLKQKTSDLLVLDAFNISSTPNADVVYREAIGAAYGAYDYYDFYRQSNAYFPSFWKPTFSLFIGLYDKVFWYSDNIASNNNAMLLESGASAIQDYMNAGGKIFIASDFANNAFPLSFNKTSPIFQYSPADSFQTFYTANQKATLPLDSLLEPDAVNGVGYPVLKVSSFADAIDPFFPKSNALVVYTAQLRRTNGVTNTKIVCAKTQNAFGKTNQVFCSVDLYKLLGDANNNGQQDELKLLFQKVLLDEFNW